MKDNILIKFFNVKNEYNKDYVTLIQSKNGQSTFLSEDYELLLKNKISKLLESSVLSMTQIDDLRIQLYSIYLIRNLNENLKGIIEFNEYQKIELLEKIKNEIKASKMSLEYQFDRLLINSDRAYENYKSFVYEWQKNALDYYVQELYYKEILKSIDNQSAIGTLINIFID